MEDYHTHYLGSTKDGRLFWGYETYVVTSPVPAGDDWTKYRREYAVLHTFDKRGNYLQSSYWTKMTVGTQEETCGNMLEDMVAALGDISLHDIKIKLFTTLIDGIEFGLIPDLENEVINLEPGATISFEEPWDGEYST